MARSEQYVIPPVRYHLISSGTPSMEITLPAGCRGLRIGTAGTLNLTMEEGGPVTSFPMMQGDNPGFFTSIQSGGTASNIWAIT